MLTQEFTQYSNWLRAGRPGFNSRQRQWWNFFLLATPRSDRLWRNPLSLLSNGNLVLFPWG